MTTAAPLRLVVVSAGVSDPSSTRMLADRLTQSVVTAAQEQDRATTVTVVDLRELLPELPAALSTQLLGPRFQRAVDALAQADGVIAAAPVYKAAASGLFTSFFQVLDNDLLIGRPVALAATAGTSRHALVVDEEMRALFAYLRALPVPTSLFASTEDWADDALGTRIDRAAHELVLLMVSGFAEAVRTQSWKRYQHTYGSDAGRELEIDTDTDLMRLATGGSLVSAQDPFDPRTA
ncbi:CE1759 family FMN reductase [Demequina capsici]|uniref:NAD(P)H-dependent oxidoreductase n=1 Tax=Demequina capsici TaxID=3075620 RepID=A0AA96F915_9MICO|nr:CE1759 family FMN reductase [Demequina sp. OYTSA14]WNM25418.1 NAD(P)H-dependent oxidoreductase [Demequina sp. OYTSA14]